MNFVSFQEIITKIQGVTHAKIIFSDEELIEAHIIANTIRSPKQIVRDIESALLAIFDYRIDRKIISIAQIDSEEKKGVKRIKYEGISIEIKDNNIECQVRLKAGDEEYSASETAISTSGNRRKVIAKATISTVEKITGQASTFDIEDININTSRDISFATVIVNMINNNCEEILIGTAVVKTDINEAIAKATLDAMNRIVEK
ncbi:MAG: hypothetical protein RR891_06660 [Clostridium sp.]|uniref:hypothetical protein n=1 Tax=Clostridium sp. TaxID=1506 RepID=UPI00305457B4